MAKNEKTVSTGAVFVVFYSCLRFLHCFSHYKFSLTPEWYMSREWYMSIALQFTSIHLHTWKNLSCCITHT